MKFVSIGTLALLGLLSAARADISISFGAAELRTAFGNELAPVGSLVIFTASTLDDSFAPPTPGSFFSGDDIEIGRTTVGSAGGVNFDAYGLTLSGNWTVGDHVQMQWYPTLNASSTSPGEGTSYGAYRTSLVKDFSTAGWFTPPEGTLETLQMLTISMGGETDNSAGWASSTVTAVPEPAEMAQAAGLVCLGVVAWRRVAARKSRMTGAS